MTVWEKIENEKCYAVAIYNFTGTSPAHLSLEVGELVHLEGETEEWYYGRSVRREAAGAFPKNYVCIRECVVDRCGATVVASAGGEGVVHDIAVTLREWLEHWKKLYVNNDELFKFMEVSMRTLLELRAQAASGALPQDQLRRVARTSVFTIDRGNRALGMELAVRNANGQLVDPLQISAYRLNMLHEEANTRIDKKMESTPATPPPPTSSVARTYAVCVRVHNFVCRMTETAELSLSLHDSAGNKLTEHLLMHWSTAVVTPTNVLFTDFGSDLMKNEKIYLVCHVVRIGSMDLQNYDHRRSSVAQPLSNWSGINGSMRRPFGVACADVKRALSEDNTDKHIQVPFYAYEKEYLDTLFKKIMTNKDLKDAKHSQGLWVSLQYIEGDLKQIMEENPHIVVGKPAIARKMGFPEVIMPGDARNDLYVTLCSGSFSKGGGKSSERNIELCARVVDKNGEPLRGVISIGANVPLMDEYTSIVYYHDDRPRWQEVFKVCLDIERFKEAHLVFLCRHRSSNEAKDRNERHFALAYLRLMQREGTTVPDGHHTLALYKIDHKRSNSSIGVDIEAASVCLGLPSRRDELPARHERGLTKGVLSLVHKDSLIVSTKLCSTKLTQREEILGVLKWSAHHTEGTLRTALTKLLQVPSEELVKFLQDILDALFNILTQVEEDHETYSDKSYGVLVLECLLRVISLVADHKYQHFQPVLHVYIDESFCEASAYENLISVMVWVTRAANTSESALKRLLMCMKCIEWLVRVIVRSRELRSTLDDSAADRDFTILFERFLESIVWLMRCGDHALTCQGSALKYLPHAVPHAIKVYPDVDLCGYVVRAMEALPLGRLSKQRMLALLELVRGPLCTAPQARSLLLSHLAVTLRALLRDKVEWDREAALKSRSVGKAARLLGADTARLHDHTHHHEIVELCVETLGEVMTLLGRDDVGSVDADRGDFAKNLLPTVLRTTASMLRERPNSEHVSSSEEALVRRMVSVLLDMMRQLSVEQYKGFIKVLESEKPGSSIPFVNEGLALILTLVEQPVFKSHWADMLHLQFNVTLHALRLSRFVERLKSVNESDSEMMAALNSQCNTFFKAGAAIATSPPLQLETLPAARRQRITQLYGDMRRSIATCLSDKWFGLGEHKILFIPDLVGPFLEVSFLRDEEVRNTTIPIFFDMMQTEYNHNVIRGEPAENYLKELESELIDKIDVLVERGAGDQEWRARFVQLCGALCGAAVGPLRSAAAALVAAAARQLDALLMYRAASLKSSTPHRMHLTTLVLDFYDGIDRPHMYIRYVHKLCAMHRAAQQWAEAGLTLRLHAKLLSWNYDPLPARLAHPGLPPRTHHAHRHLKEYLYTEIAELLNRGRQWELAVEIVKELVSVYEEEALGYGPLADLHNQLASLYTAMLRTLRCHPAYFRVIYYGKGFPELLRKPLGPKTPSCSMGFVYRANEYEQLQDFKERMLDEWPDAEVLSKLDTPGEDITESDGQYLQINALDPVTSDRLKRLSGKPIAEQILQYYKHNDVDKFYFSRPVYKPDETLAGSSDDLSRKTNTFAMMWLERTELEIKDKLPSVLRWSAVVRQRQYSVSPLEAALESLRNINRMLKSVTCEARPPDAPLHPLTMRLTGILDPAVQGGIKNYEESFLTPSYEVRHPEDASLLAELKDLIAEQIPLLKFGLDVHGSRVPPEQEELHARLLSCFHVMQQHVHQRYGRKTCDYESETQDVQFRINLRDSLYTDPGNLTSNRISDISNENDGPLKSSGRFFSAINPLSRNSSTSVTGYFGTLQSTPKRRNKRQVRKSEVGTQASGTQSQWYTTHSTPNGSVNNTSALQSPTCALVGSPQPTDSHGASPLRELRQELVTERPLRADVERERRLSARASIINNNNSAPHSNRDSMGTTDSNQEEEEPPPLPEKYSHRSMELVNDSNNNTGGTPLPRRHNYDSVWTPRGSALYNSIVHRRNTTNTLTNTSNEKAPTPPPKKRNGN